MTAMSNIIRAELTQYTPLLHFQGQQDGACLRASEVKPALDRFIRAWLKKQGVNNVKDAWIYTSDDNDNKNKRHIAFRYRMTFRARSNPQTQGQYPYTYMYKENEKLKGDIHRLFFAAMGDEAFDKNGQSKIKGVFYNDGMSMTILVPCAETVCIDDKNKSLADVIRELLPSFFALHCFGNRSNKGFGSFGVKSINDTDVDPLSPEALKSYAPLGTVYYAAYSHNQFSNDNPINRHKKYLDDVFMLSQVIKAGLNYTGGDKRDPRYFKGLIFQYFLKDEQNQIHSEKKYIKDKMLRLGDPPANNYRFVRAIIGLPQNYDYKKSYTPYDFNVVIGFEADDDKKKIIRFENPIHYKPHGQYLLLIPQIIPEKMYNQTFKLNNDSIETPDNQSFDIEKFLDYCCDKYASERNQLMNKFNPQNTYFRQNRPRISVRASEPIYHSLKRVSPIQKSGGDDNG